MDFRALRWFWMSKFSSHTFLKKQTSDDHSSVDCCILRLHQGLSARSQVHRHPGETLLEPLVLLFWDPKYMIIYVYCLADIDDDDDDEMMATMVRIID